ncbi:MAG: peptide chain release factor 1 [Deltaproteobacteria bacterium]|nr:peptide chain release factor 1 [Deltaproteobacteria bacterium]
MFAKLEEVESRYEELGRLLQDPAVYSDPARLQKIARERKGLEEIVACFRSFRKVEKDIRGNQELVREGDGDLAELAAAELPALERRKQELERQLKVLLLPDDPRDAKNILLEIRAGAGGEEAALFAADLFRMYSRYAEQRGWKVELMSESLASAGGFKEVVALLSGERVYSTMKFEGGVHRVQRVPVTESQGRIHTSTVTVAVLPEADEVDVSIDERDLEISVCRAGGPGGQGVNTTDSAVRITHIPSGMTVQCQDERSQIKNKAKAMKVLRARLYEKKLAEQQAARSEDRRTMVGTGDRAEKIRTYNFPQNRVTDHRISLTLHKLDRLIEGELDEIIDSLKAHYQAEALKGGTS